MKVSRWSRQFRLRSGVTLIWTAIALLLLIGLAGLVCDLAYVTIINHQLQNAADAASLAGAQWVTADLTQARLAATNMAANNSAGGSAVQLADGDIVFGYYDRTARTFTPTTTSPNAVSVTASRTSNSLGGGVPLFFGNIFNVSTVDLQRSAIAMTDGIAAGLIILDKHADGALTLKGSGSSDKITVTNGGVLVNSDSANAVSANGNSMINSQDVYLVSGQSLSGHLGPTDEQHKLPGPITDPLASVPDVVVSSLPVRVYPQNTVNIQAGYYPSGLPVSSNLMLAPGIYAIKGDLNKNVTGTGVMIYLIDGTLGDATINISPPTSGPYAGISIFQARNNSTSCTYTGNNQVDIEGTVYMPAAHLELRGTPDTFSNQLIVDTLELRGTATISVNYNFSFPIPTGKSFLVQ